jgi:hypothetical protein
MQNIYKLSVVIIIALMYFTLAGNTFAFEKTARTSASLEDTTQNVRRDTRAKLLRAYLEKYESPLANESETFVMEADKYSIDYRLLPAIAGVESWFGTRLPANSYNGWGYGIYGTNVRYFSSWKDAIHTISKDIREKYMDQWNAQDVYGVGRRYASDPAWAQKVTHFIGDMELFESTQQNKAISISL